MDIDTTRTTLLYESVLDIERKDLDDADIIKAIEEIKTAYRYISNNAPVTIINYNCSKYRFAYIYLYALCHTHMVDEQLKQLERLSLHTFHSMLKLGKNILNLCSLGGGPGCDVIGILKKLDEYPSSSFFNASPSTDCTIIDVCEGWNQSFSNLLQSDIARRYNSRLNSSSFLTANILYPVLDDATKSAIRKADLVTMVKFVSVVAYYCKNNSRYLQEIFQLMKSDSYLLFLDNSIGEIYNTFSKSAEENGLSFCFHRKNFHRFGENMKFSKHKFATEPMSCASIIFAVWKKD